MSARTLKTNFVINVLGALVPLAVALVTVPIYVRHIGDARYGVLSIVWVLLGYFGFLDLGLSRAAVNALSRLRYAPQPARARVLVTTLVLNLGLGLLGSFCLAVLGGYLLQHVLAVPEMLKPEIAQAFPWIVALFPLALVSGVGIGALESREHFLLANLLQVSGMSLGQIVPVILAVIISPSLAIVIPAATITRAMTMLVILIAVHRNERPLSLAAFDRNQAGALLSYGGWVSVSSAIVPFLVSFDQVIIGSVLGVASITYFAIPMNLVTRSQFFPGALIRTLFPRLSSSAPVDARALSSRALVALAHSYGAICAPAIIVTPTFFKYWISPEFAVIASPVAEVLFFGAWANALASVPYGLLQSQGRPDITGKYHAAQVFPFVAILWAMTSVFGIIGAAAAYSLRGAADVLVMCWLSGVSRRDVLQSLIPLVYLLLCAEIANGSSLSPLMVLFISALIFATAFAVAVPMSLEIRTTALLGFRLLTRVFRRDVAVD